MRHALMAVFAFLFPSAVAAQTVPVPVDIQVSLMMRVLTFDRNLKERVADTLTLGILFQRPFHASLRVKEDFARALARESNMALDGIPIRLVEVDVADSETLFSLLKLSKVVLLYVAPLRGLNIDDITHATRTHKILTISGVPEYAKQGLAMAFGTRGDRPEIIINLPAARMEGADFSAHLLRLARVIQ